MTTPAQNFTTPAQINQDLLNFMLEQHKDGKSQETIRTRIQALKQVAKTTDINNPDKVKEYIANYPKWNSRTKTKFIDSYSAYLRFKHIQWTPPKYVQQTKLPFIPTEQEIDLLVSATEKATSTVIQTLKETGIRIGELVLLKWIDLDTERKTLRITPEKGSNPRILPISDKLIGMLNSLPKKHQTLFQPYKDALRDYLCVQRKQLAQKLNNPRLLQISFHTLRHWKGTTEYHKTKDIIRVQHLLGHKSITSTLVYINLESALYLQSSENFVCKTAHNIDEATQLIEAGFEYVSTMDNIQLFRKRK